MSRGIWGGVVALAIAALGAWTWYLSGEMEAQREVRTRLHEVVTPPGWDDAAQLALGDEIIRELRIGDTTRLQILADVIRSPDRKFRRERSAAVGVMCQLAVHSPLAFTQWRDLIDAREFSVSERSDLMMGFRRDVAGVNDARVVEALCAVATTRGVEESIRRAALHGIRDVEEQPGAGQACFMLLALDREETRNVRLSAVSALVSSTGDWDQSGFESALDRRGVEDDDELIGEVREWYRLETRQRQGN